MNKILLIITVTLLFLVPYDNAKCYDMPYSDEFYRENPDIYEQHLKEAEFRKNSEFYKGINGHAAVATDGGLSTFTRKYRDKIVEEQRLFVQQKFDERNFIYRLFKGIQYELLSIDIRKLYQEKTRLEQLGFNTIQMQAKIQSQEQKLAQIPTGANNTAIAKKLASFLVSIWDKYELLFWLISSFFVVYFILKIVTKIKLLIKNDEQTYLNETCKKLAAIYINYANLATTENINDAKKHLLFCKRAKEVDELNLSKQIDDWTGIIKDIKVAKADIEETGNVIIEFAPNVEIQIPFSFKNDEGIAEIIGELQIGDLIKFSGILEKCEDKEVPVVYSRAKISPFRTEMIVKADSISLLQKKKKTWLK